MGASPCRHSNIRILGANAARICLLTLDHVLLCHSNESLYRAARQRMQNRISLFRAERGTSRRELAEAVGVNNQTIGYLERGDYKPSLELAMKMAQYFGVSVEMLFSLERFEPIAMTLRRAGEEE
jgi:putative transcriptional regulator